MTRRRALRNRSRANGRIGESLASASGARVDDGAPRTAPDDNRTLQIGLKPLAPGDYRVEWHATSVDTHKTQGAFGFTVRQ